MATSADVATRPSRDSRIEDELIFLWEQPVAIFNRCNVCVEHKNYTVCDLIYMLSLADRFGYAKSILKAVFDCVLFASANRGVIRL